ncbi:hypothetical protein WN944_016849 [Citrus x changshan-huyou]|uniref:Uncharacterized protein n=1 Tax=Citrus x changshan-huyou TaxID=2935761 RepID=A0AAP0MCT1_9ROSI
MESLVLSRFFSSWFEFVTAASVMGLDDPYLSTILAGVPEAFSEMGHVVADVFLSVSQSVSHCKEPYTVLCPCKESYAVPMTL